MFERVELNDLDIWSGDYLVEEIRGLGSPAPRADRLDRPRAHGAVDRTQFYGPRVLELIGVVGGDDPASTWAAFDRLKAELGTLAAAEDVIFRVQRAGLDAERLLVRVDGQVDCAVYPNGIRWGCQLVAADPRIYGDALKIAQYDPTVVGAGGVEFPLEFPLVFAQVVSGFLVVENQGTFPTPPVLRVTGPVNRPEVESETLGQSIVTTAELGIGDELEINVASRRVTLNGQHRPDLVDVSTTTWWELPPGSSQVRLRGSDMASGQTALAVEFRDARI